jgi:hypothetical protein
MNWFLPIRRFFNLDILLLLFLALVKLLIHFYTNGNYGIHRDEFLYLAMGDHLSWGYLEVPPSIAILGDLTRWLWGDSLFAIRFFPAVLGSLIVLLTGLMVWELGGNRFAMLLACVSVIIAPVYLRGNTLFQPVTFDQFYWVLGFLILILLINKKQRNHLWIFLGVVCGMGLLNKYSMFFWGFALLVGLLLTPHRKHLLTKWPWIAAAIAFVIFLPNLIWQISHGWPFFEHIHKLNEYQFSNLTRGDFLFGQVLIMHPVTFPVWLLGIGYFFVKKMARPYRILGWMYLTILGLMLILKSKHYYLAPVYPVLFAGGAIYMERFIRIHRFYWTKPFIIVFLLFQGILFAPYGLPFLPVSDLEIYAGFLAKYPGLDAPLRKESGKLGKIPQDYADMFGWEEQVSAIAEVYHSLSPEEQAECVLLAGNYGEAGAIDFYGEKYNLPKAVSLNSSYYLWGPGEKPGRVVISMGVPLEALRRYFRSIRRQTTIRHEYAISSENDLPVYLCRDPVKALQKVWPELKGFR